MSLTLNAAQAMIERARAHATDIGVPMNIAVTDGGRHLPYAGGVAMNDGDGSLIGAIGVSGGLPAQDGEVARAAIGSEQR
jgi:uncharacterized protein GlcG (DUF336 family)